MDRQVKKSPVHRNLKQTGHTHSPRKYVNTGSARDDMILQLQTTAGNQAVAQLLNKASSADNSNHQPVIQRQLPKDGPPATQGQYTASPDSKYEIYTGGRPASFSKEFRNYVLQMNGYSMKSTEKDINLVQERGTDFYWLPEDVFQLDHIHSWDDIQSDMTTIANHLTGELQKGNMIPNILHDLYVVYDSDFDEIITWDTPDLLDRFNNGDSLHVYPSMYGARMYFHDIDNIRPLTGGINAAKGTNDALEDDLQYPPTSVIEGDFTVAHYNFIDQIREAQNEDQLREKTLIHIQKLKEIAGIFD